jgi:toxin ParE1/3/4
MPTIRISPPAAMDILAIARYLIAAGAGYDVTDKFIDDLHEKFAAYARQPRMGTLCEDLGDDLRCFSFRKNYVVVYRLLDDGVEVLRMFHTARDYQRLFFEGQ